MANMKKLRDLPEIDRLKTANEADTQRIKKVIAARPATVKPFEKMTAADKDAALKALFLEHGLCS